MGAGAIGSLFGGYLKKSGQDVILIGKEWNVKPIKEHGLELVPFNSEDTLNIKIEATTDPATCGFQDLVILTVKAYDTKSALIDAEPIIKSGHTRILCLQNGYGTEIIASQLYGKSSTLRGVTSHGAVITPGHVIHTGLGDTFIGQLDPNTKIDDIIEIFNQANIKTKFVENIQDIIWSKVLVNASINPFGALTKLRNGQLLENSDIVECMKQVIREGVNVLNSHGIKLNINNAIENAIRVAKMTALNKNSMLQDIEKGRRTEIDYINKAISELGKENGIKTPMNYLLTALIKGLEYSIKN